MPRFFVDKLDCSNLICGEDAKHIAKSLRMSVGDSILLCDKQGMEGIGTICAMEGDTVAVDVGKIAVSPNEPTLKISLYICWPKGDKAEIQTQKAVELGAFEVVFVMSSRSISRPEGKDAVKKIERCQKIAREAAGQSNRGIIPSIRGIISFDKALEEMEAFPQKFLLYEGNCVSLRGQLSKEKGAMALFTGCEGGFSPQEVARCEGAGVLPVSLGRRILRCETAAPAVLSAVMFYMGEMD